MHEHPAAMVREKQLTAWLIPHKKGIFSHNEGCERLNKPFDPFGNKPEDCNNRQSTESFCEHFLMITSSVSA